jgi:3-oxoacyl-[acyl-carrier protein] reductase
MKFTSKVALITGCNSGIGYATCLLFAKEKCEILALDLDTEINPNLKVKLKSLGAAFTYFSCDVSDYSAVSAVFEIIKDTHPHLNFLVNNAGILGPRLKTENYEVADFDSVINVNVKGVYYMMKAVLPLFVKQNQGVIINTASVAGHLGMQGHIAYSASKHAVVGMTKTVALEYAQTGIRVNAVCPGFTQTAMLDKAVLDPEYVATLKYATPMKRFAEAGEIASAIVFLASNDASFMTGQSLILDGGLSVQ